MPSDTTTLRGSLRALKASVADAARVAVAAFEQQTGLTPKTIEIELDVLDLTTHGDREPVGQARVRGVRVTVREVDLD